MRLSLLLLLFAAALLAPVAAQPFTLLAPPADGSGSIIAYAVSADGSVVVGSYGATSAPGQGRAYRWTAADGAVRLVPETDPFQPESATDVSADGSVIVGYGRSSAGVEAYRWTAAGGVERLGRLPGRTTSWGQGVSADGATVVGYSGETAFLWTAAGGMKDLGVLPAPVNGNCAASAVSADGAVAVGVCSRFTPGSGTQTEAFRWTRAGGIVGLGDLGPAGDPLGSSAFDVSDDGAVVVGQAGLGSSGSQQFVWTAADGMVGLPFEFTYTGRARADAISADGRVVGGFDFENSSAPTAVVWTAASGVVPVRDFLPAPLPPTQLLDAVHGLSASGTVAVGSGYDFGTSQGFAWRAELAFPSDGEDTPGAAFALAVGPNPSAGAATVRLRVPATAEARVRVVDRLGREVALLHDGVLAAGAHAVAVPTRLPAGVYVVEAWWGAERRVSRLTVVR